MMLKPRLPGLCLATRLFIAYGDFYRLLITFVNSLDPDQTPKNGAPELGRNCSDTLMVFLKEIFESEFLKK